MKKIWFSLLLILLVTGCTKKKEEKLTCEQLLLNAGVSETKVTAKIYNTYGYRYYKKKEYKKAIILFECAIGMNPNYVYAQYNYACTLSILKGRGEEINIKKLFKHLEQAVLQRPAYARKMMSDCDLEPVREMQEYKELVARCKKSDKPGCALKLKSFPGLYSGRKTGADSEGAKYSVEIRKSDDKYFFNIDAGLYGSVVGGMIVGCDYNGSEYSLVITLEDGIKVELKKGLNGLSVTVLNYRGNYRQTIDEINSETFKYKYKL